MGGVVYAPIIIPLRGPSCKLRFARISDRLKFQDGPSVAIWQNMSVFQDNLGGWNIFCNSLVFFDSFWKRP